MGLIVCHGDLRNLFIGMQRHIDGRAMNRTDHLLAAVRMDDDDPGMGVLRPFHTAIAANRIFRMGRSPPELNQKDCRKDHHPGQPGICIVGHAGFLQALNLKEIVIRKLVIKTKHL
jgi:hypothetical protein